MGASAINFASRVVHFEHWENKVRHLIALLVKSRPLAVFVVEFSSERFRCQFFVFNAPGTFEFRCIHPVFKHKTIAFVQTYKASPVTILVLGSLLEFETEDTTVSKDNRYSFI